MTVSVSAHRFARRFACGASVALALIAGCSSESPATAQPSVDATPTGLEPSPSFRKFMRGVLGPGKTLEETCHAGTAESVRVTLYHGLPQPVMPSDRVDEFDRAGYTVVVTADGKGAVAHWRGIGELLNADGFRTYGAQAVRLDGNGWRQLQQLLREPRFLRIDSFAEQAGNFAPHTGPSPMWIEHCRDGRYRLLMRVGEPDDAGSQDFQRVAQAVLRLGGDVYPGDRDKRPRLRP